MKSMGSSWENLIIQLGLKGLRFLYTPLRVFCIMNNPMNLFYTRYLVKPFIKLKLIELGFEIKYIHKKF